MSPKDVNDNRIEEKMLSRSVSRARGLTFFFSMLSIVFGFTSMGFITKFDGSVTLASNVLPRLCFGFLPLLGLWMFLERSKAKNATKLWIWLIWNCVVFDIQASIHVWPIAWRGNPEILFYVHATNCAIFAAILLTLALPTTHLIKAWLMILAISYVPLFVVAWQAGDSDFFVSIVTESIFILGSAGLLSQSAYRVYLQLAKLEIEQEDTATKFLGPVVSSAIFQGQKRLLEKTVRKGYVVSIDIRDSTELQKEFRDRWLNFRRDYFALVSKAVSKHNAYLQKTVGDCHVINFGMLDNDPDLSDIPGIEDDLARAEERRLAHVGQDAFNCLDMIFTDFAQLVSKYFPYRLVRLGGGIDKGLLEKAVQGDENHWLELDVNGEAVNCSNRLQEFSKTLKDQFAPGASLLVISPFASDYIENTQGYRRVETRSEVRNYPGIKWVLVKEYASQKRKDKKAA